MRARAIEAEQRLLPPPPLHPREAGISIQGAGRTYPARRRGVPVRALSGLDLAVGRGEVVAVVGPSGCGKSTLLELVGGLQEPDRGRISVAGAAEPSGRVAACARMPQRDLLLPWRDAAANAALALECRGVSRTEADREASALLGRLGLAGFERARPPELSGGMRQRVAFVRTLLAGRPILLLDEPLAGLDAITRASTQEWLSGILATERRTVLCVTHDVEEALYLADRVAVLSARPGRVVAELPVDRPRPRARRETVTSAWFAELKAVVLEALEA